MISTRLRESFEHAHYLHLVGGDFRAAMVQCGVEALLDGLEGSNILRLAGADEDDQDVLVAVFRGAAREAGVHLPDERVWTIRRTEALERAGRGVEPRARERVFEDRVFLIRQHLIERNPDPELAAFLGHLDGRSDDYGVWLDELCELAQRVTGRGLVGRVVAGVVDAFQAQAYGATTEAHLEALSRLLAEVDQKRTAEER